VGEREHPRGGDEPVHIGNAKDEAGAEHVLDERTDGDLAELECDVDVAARAGDAIDCDA
jgi:hypothetical protein